MSVNTTDTAKYQLFTVNFYSFVRLVQMKFSEMYGEKIITFGVVSQLLAMLQTVCIRS